jgi:tRNA(fMet)-specific endonuclease VapC
LNISLIDTDIFSEMTKAVNPTVVANATAYRKLHSQYTISSITLMEMIRGYEKKQATSQLQRFLASIAAEEVLAFDRAAAELAGRITGELERSGQPIGLSDPMIAAIALRHRLQLVTGNTAHFQRVQQIGYPLVLANWRL